MDIIIIGKKSRKPTEKPELVYLGQSRLDANEAVKKAGGKYGYMYRVNPFPIAPVKEPGLSERIKAKEAKDLEEARQRKAEELAKDLSLKLAAAQREWQTAQNAAVEARSVATQLKTKELDGAREAAEQAVKLEKVAAGLLEVVQEIQAEIDKQSEEDATDETPLPGTKQEIAAAARAKANEARQAADAAAGKPGVKQLRELAEKLEQEALEAEEAAAE